MLQQLAEINKFCFLRKIYSFGCITCNLVLQIHVGETTPL